MKLGHVAFLISEVSEIKNFYLDILNMKEIRNFKINESLTEKIFGIQKEVIVYQLQSDNTVFEIFVSDKPAKIEFQHICISVNNIELLYSKAINNNYECVRIKRGIADMIFIKDKSGNIFEIKQL